MKRKTAVFCALVMIISSLAQSVGAINVILNSSLLEFKDQEPVIVCDTTLVPIRDIAEALGLEVTWDDPSDTVTIKKDNFFVELVIGKTTAKTSSGTKTMLVAPQIINSRTMVPLRFIAEELGLIVTWSDKYQRVIINGQIDTQKAPVIEETTEVEDETQVEEPTDEEATSVLEVTEEETEAVDDGQEFYQISAMGSTINFVMPVSFTYEDTENEESFAYKTLDATDSQHTYDWESVTLYESFADESGTSGIAVIVQELAPFEGEEYDISAMTQEYPEAPERPERPQMPEIDWEVFLSEYALAIKKQLFIDMELEVPENVEEMSDEDVMAALGLETKEEMDEQTALAQETADFSEVSGYDEYMAYQDEYASYNEEFAIYREDMAIYNEEVNQIKAAKEYIFRNFNSLYEKASDDDWAMFFDARLNTDEEVRYEGVEILGEKKKIVHATLYAADPDDEQGVYDYYYYIDGDCVVTIYGGTLFGGEPAPEAVDALSNMYID